MPAEQRQKEYLHLPQGFPGQIVKLRIGLDDRVRHIRHRCPGIDGVVVIDRGHRNVVILLGITVVAEHRHLGGIIQQAWAAVRRHWHCYPRQIVLPADGVKLIGKKIDAETQFHDRIHRGVAETRDVQGCGSGLWDAHNYLMG